jgi:glycerophosphoryl diester phosphodiesterase
MKIIGHRGAKGLRTENTIASIHTALKHNVNGIEVDVHVTKDNVAVLHHDHAFTDPSGEKIELHKTTYKELLVHKPDMATLEQLFTEVQGKVHITIEIKERVDVREPARVIAAAIKQGLKPEDISIASFDFSVLKEAKRLLPSVEVVVNEQWSSIRGTYRARTLGTKRLSMDKRWLWKGFLKSMHNHGYQVSPYTVNDPAVAKKWEPYIYGIFTDYPDRFNKKP